MIEHCRRMDRVLSRTKACRSRPCPIPVALALQRLQSQSSSCIAIIFTRRSTQRGLGHKEPCLYYQRLTRHPARSKARREHSRSKRSTQRGRPFLSLMITSTESGPSVARGASVSSTSGQSPPLLRPDLTSLNVQPSTGSTQCVSMLAGQLTLTLTLKKLKRSLRLACSLNQPTCNDHQQLGASTHPFSKVFVSDDADRRTVRRHVAQNDRLAIPFGRGLRCRRVHLQGPL